jgi:hypothetical protein
MTSKPPACFVYITLPGATSAVTAGKFVLDRNRAGDPLGRFVYGKSYLENAQAVPIDPVELKLAEATFETVQLNGVFGALRDAGPISGDGASSRNTRARRSSARWTICSSRPTTAPALSASG